MLDLVPNTPISIKTYTVYVNKWYAIEMSRTIRFLKSLGVINIRVLQPFQGALACSCVYLTLVLLILKYTLETAR